MRAPASLSLPTVALVVLALVGTDGVAAPPRGPTKSPRVRPTKKARVRPAKPRQKRSIASPYREHVAPDFNRPSPNFKKPKNRIRLNKRLPRPTFAKNVCVPKWNSVALFFNLNMKGAANPKGYTNTSAQFAKNMLDEGTDPAMPGISDFLCNYWNTVSHGNLAFGLDTPRDTAGNPLVPTMNVPSGGAYDWTALIKAAFDANAVKIWQAAGSLTLDGKRWVPSVVLFQNYDVGATAAYGSIEHTVGGNTYAIGDRTHIRSKLDKYSPPEAPSKEGRKWWGTLLHEYAHNFLEFGDLYGPQGCTGYWDLLGDNSPPGRASEISAAQKERIGWLSFKKVIQGPTKPMSLSLLPYTTSGEAIKIVPDPVNTPQEYFVLEYRKSTGSESWRPDGALKEQGLFISHFNQRLGIPPTWINRDSPFFDPEFGDGSHQGATDWTGHDDLDGKVFPQGSKDRFTPTSVPSSNFYGGRKSGLYVTDIEVKGGKVHFKVMVSGTQSKIGWQVSKKDRGLSGHFTPASLEKGAEVFLRNDDNAAILQERDNQWMVETSSAGWVNKWNLGVSDREAVGDLDGDGLDEVWIRSAGWAGVLKYKGIKLTSTILSKSTIGSWALGKSDWEHIGDFDGDGRDEIYIRRNNAAGVVDYFGCPAGSACSKSASLTLGAFHKNKIGSWSLSAKDEEVVGNFRVAGQDEIAIFGDDAIGLLAWDKKAKGLKLVKKQTGWVDGWNLGVNDRYHVGDFDGDGLDEIYIRSASWAGLIEWSSGKFKVKWMAKGPLTGAKSLTLAASDRSYAGHFRIDRDAILHRESSGLLSLLVWNGSAMAVDQRTKSSKLSGWSIGNGDNWILGDFHATGGDVVDVGKDYATDGITDVFMHNGWGTGMLGFNPRKVNPEKWSDKRFGLTWIQSSKLLKAP